MACNIIIKNNIQVGVKDAQGNPSKLFQSILSNPHITGFQDSLSHYLNVEGQDDLELSYSNGTQTFSSFGAALKNTENGEIKAFAGETQLFSVDSSISTKSYNGLINNLIKTDLIQDQTVLDTDGKKLFIPVGQGTYKAYITSDMAKTTARGVVGYKAKTDAAGNLYFEQEQIGKIPLYDKKDNVTYITQEQLDRRDYKRLKQTTADPIGIMAERAYKENNRAFGNTKPVIELEIIPEDLLQEKLLALLNKMGVSTIALENYAGKYNTNAQALADIANKIVAFKDGNVTTADLTEEVSHFIIEATENSTIENLLRNVHKTQEWIQFEQAYRAIYSENYQGVELEDIIRKEILGKVLANSLQQNFEQNRASETENTFVARLLDIFNTFINHISSYFRADFQQELDRYTQSVYNNLMQDSLYDELSTEQLDGKKYVLYSIDQAGKSPEYRQYEKALNQLSAQQTQLRKKYATPALDNQLTDAKQALATAIETTEKDIERTATLKALTGIAKVAQGQIDYLSRALDENIKNNHHFSQEEQAVYQNFIGKLEPMLAQISNKLNTKDKAEKSIKTSIENVLRKAVEVRGKVPSNNEAAIEKMIDGIVAKNNLTGIEEQKFREQLKRVLEAGQKDTAWFHANLGTLLHAQNIYLNLAGDVIARTTTEARAPFLKNMKNFLNKLEEIGYDPRQLKKFIDSSGRIENEDDNDKLQSLYDAEKLRIYNEITDGSLTEFKQDLVDTLDAENRLSFTKAFGEYRKSNMESYFSEEHQAKLDNTFIKINGEKLYRKDIPVEALEYEDAYRGQLRQIRVNNGGVNTAGDVKQIEELNSDRVYASSPRNDDGSLKNGLREVYNEELGQYIVELDPSTLTSEEEAREANKVYGLQMLSLLNREFYKDSERDGTIPQNFLDELNKLDTEQEKWDFVQRNAYIGFTQDYWDNYGQNQSLRDRLIEQKNGENDAEIDEVLEDIRTQQQIISNALRANRKYNQPSETNAEAMHETVKGTIREASALLESYYNKANSFLPREERQETDSETFSENRTNEAYKQETEAEGLVTVRDKISFILKHVTPNNNARINKAIKVVNSIRDNKEISIDKSLQNTFTEEMSLSEAEDALLAYAESRVLPYYKRTEPTGYSQERTAFQTALDNNVQNTVENYLTSSEFVQISPNYSFYEQTDAINPKWLANKEAKRPQYTEEFREKIKNKEFYKKYGIDNQGNPTKNLKDWQAREALLALQDDTIEAYGLTGKHDRYLLPQQHKTHFRRLAGALTNPGALKESLAELVNFREDEAETGQDNQGNRANSNQILSIPMYGVRPITNQQDVTDELLYSYAWMNQQAHLHAARKRNISDMMVLNDAILNTDFAGKSAEATNTYKMFKSFLNSNYFGVNQSFTYEISILGQKVDLGKLAKGFNSWVRFLNLTGVVVPLTSFLQSTVQKNVEAAVGQTTNVTAANLARKEFFKYASGAAGETMKLTSKNKLNILGESYGVYDLVNSRFENSNFNKATRTVNQLSSGLHSLGNFGVIPSVLLSVLYDNRYYNGKIISYNQYLRINGATQSKPELLKQWKTLDLFYNDISTVGGVQEYKKENIQQKTGWTDEQYETNIRNIHEALTNRINAAVQDVDTQIRPEEASIAARDARAQFVLLHSNWFILALTNRLKSYHYDIARQTYSEGSWVTAVNFLQDLVIRRKEVKKVWNEALTDEVKRRNLRRTLIDVGVANALMAVALLLAKAVDDDDDAPYPLLFLDYFGTRVASEQVSSTLALPRQIAQTIEDPLISFGRFKDIFNVLDVFSGEEITRGAWAGSTASEKWIYSNTPVLKDFRRLGNIKQSTDTYRYFNSDLQDWAFLSDYLLGDEEE